MSVIEIKLGTTRARISTLGAELVSLSRDGKEYLWQGDPAFWAGRSPLLFPNTGSFWNGVYRIDDRTYAMEKHGFARTMEFSVVEQLESSVTFAIHSDDKTLSVYPFAFFLFVTYRLHDNGLEVSWMVRNESDCDMHFAIGAHPAFNLPSYNAEEKIHGYFSFKTEKPIEYLIPTEKGCIDDKHPRRLELDSDGMMAITADTFDIDTYVIESSDISRCTLLTPERKPYLAVEFDMAVLSLWAPTAEHPDCPFVAIEPWAGSCDTVGYEGQLSERRHINHVGPGEAFHTAYRIILF